MVRSLIHCNSTLTQTVFFGIVTYESLVLPAGALPLGVFLVDEVLPLRVGPSPGTSATMATVIGGTEVCF